MKIEISAENEGFWNFFINGFSLVCRVPAAHLIQYIENDPYS
jgi:hypothetical protein